MLKTAYELGVQAAMIDAGLVKEGKTGLLRSVGAKVKGLKGALDNKLYLKARKQLGHRLALKERGYPKGEVDELMLGNKPSYAREIPAALGTSPIAGSLLGSGVGAGTGALVAGEGDAGKGALIGALLGAGVGGAGAGAARKMRHLADDVAHLKATMNLPLHGRNLRSRAELFR
jgi:hypothetical protein